MRRCDVLIVGGGPGGSSCAWALRDSGLDVCVMDKRTFPRDKVCAGWVTPQVLRTLQVDAGQYRAGRVLQPISRFITGVIDGPQRLLEYDEVVSYGIRRCEFDTYLLARCGARTLQGEALRSMRREGGRWIVNDAIDAAVIVGAGGHNCPVARQLGARQDKRHTVVAAQEIEFAPTPEQLARCSVRGDTPELFFCRDLQGYGWVFRKGDYLNIGLGRTDGDQLPAHVQHFVEFLRHRGKVMCDLPGRFHGHAYQLYERTSPRLIDEGVMLIGDAAGLAYPQSGEGIRPAVESGIMAAQVIREAAGDYRLARLQPYADRIQARFGEPRRAAATAWLPNALIGVLADRLLTNRWFARNVLIDRWFLHRDQPVLSA